MAQYEGAIDHFARKGMIDPRRVGIVGWSRTTFYIDYTLTHSTRWFAAAATADGSDNGYFQYLALSNYRPEYDLEFESMNGGLPFGAGLRHWLSRAPGFNLNKVSTPIRITAMRSLSVLLGWEWYAGLSRLGKPAEFVLLPDGEHMLTKPRERLLLQQSTVDWFDFWLNGRENLDHENAEQYRRWERLCEMQRIQNPDRRILCVSRER
jgi:dipeptidyl aminopeptidase/acylaminoacyl peptidase